MLVLSRLVGDKILIAPNICITVMEIRRDQVRIGIDAPRSVEIARPETIPPAEAESIERAARGLS